MSRTGRIETKHSRITVWVLRALIQYTCLADLLVLCAVALWLDWLSIEAQESRRPVDSAHADIEIQTYLESPREMPEAGSELVDSRSKALCEARCVRL
jgi:hypothetical protein